MPIDVRPFRAARTNDRIHAIVTAVPTLRSCGGTCFLLLEEVAADAPRRSIDTTRVTAPMVATAIERIATAEDLPTDPRVWLAMCADHISAALPAVATARWSACIGIAYDIHGGIGVSLAAIGNVRASLLRWDGHSLPQDVVTPHRPQPTLQLRNAMDGALTPQDTLLITIGEDTAMRANNRAALVRRLAADASLHRPPAPDRDPLPPAAITIGIHGPPPHGDAHTSMRSFLATAATAERFVTPTLLPIIRSWCADLRHACIATPSGSRRSRPTARRWLVAAVGGMRFVYHGIGVLIRSVAAITTDAYRLIRHIRHPHPAVPSPRPTPTERAAAQPRRMLFPRPAALAAWYRALPRSSQLSLLLACTFAALFVLSTTALWRRRVTDIAIARIESTIATIEELRSIAEAKLLFGDRPAAIDALRTAEEHLRTLPRTTRPRRERAALLERELAAAFDRARLITRIPTPLLVAHGGTTIPFPTVADIAVVDGRLVITAADGSAVAIMDPRTGSVTTRPVAGTTTTRPATTLVLDDRTLLVLDDRAQIATIDLTTGTRTPASITAPPPNIVAATTARGRLHLLARNGSVTRHERTAGGFSRGAIVIAAPRNASPAATIATNGAVTVIAGERALTRYEQSRRLATDLLAHVDPPITHMTSIAVGRSGERIYIGDPIEGRVVVVSRTGTLVGQLAAPAFRSLRRIVVDQKEAAIYVLHDESVSVVVPPKSADER